MIWQFEKCSVYVLGSIHVMGADQNSHTRSIDETFNLVSQVVFETSLDFGDLPITRYRNEKLSDNISKTLFRDVKKTWIKYGLPIPKLEQSKIWNAALSIGNHIFRRIGLEYENGIDKIIWDKSHRSNKNVHWLEEQEVGLLCFENSPSEEQQKFLIEAVRNKRKIIQVISETIEGWNASSEQRLVNILQSSLEDYPTLFNCLIIERNRQWVNIFLEALKSSTPTLFVVGALHCVGDCSILSILGREHGYPSKLINVESRN